MSKINGLPGGELADEELARLTKAIQKDFEAMRTKHKKGGDTKMVTPYWKLRGVKEDCYLCRWLKQIINSVHVTNSLKNLAKGNLERHRAGKSHDNNYNEKYGR